MGKLVRSLGGARVPKTITQEPLDHDSSHYRRLCRQDNRPDPSDLYSYADDLMYQEIQVDLLLCLLPVCLAAWREDLMASNRSDYAGFVEQFSAALAKQGGFRSLLAEEQWRAVAGFMREAILDKLDSEKELAFSGMGASPYSWNGAIVTYGVVFPALPELWREWWSGATFGRACGILQYVSTLMYPEDENPIFAPWTREKGGGSPVLWETDGHIHEQSWLPENVSFLREALSLSKVRTAVDLAAQRIENDIDCPVAGIMQRDFDDAAARIELRIEELLEYLSSPLGEVREWVTT